MATNPESEDGIGHHMIIRLLSDYITAFLYYYILILLYDYIKGMLHQSPTL